MHFNPEHHRAVMNFISYLASQAKSLKTMAQDGRSFYDISIALLAVNGQFEQLFPNFYFMLQQEIMDYTNPLLDHPELDEETLSKVHEIRSSASDMDVMKLAKTIAELHGIIKLLP
jgi:hypothetical protein